MKTILVSLTVLVSIPAVFALETLKDDRTAKEQFINVSREKLALEIEARKLKEQLKISEQKNQEVLTEIKELEKEVATLEKDLSKSDSLRDKCDETLKAHQTAIEALNRSLKTFQ